MEARSEVLGIALEHAAGIIWIQDIKNEEEHCRL